MLGLALVVATQIVRAQEPGLGNIPFAFMAGTMALPAGEYGVERSATGCVVPLIQCTDSRAFDNAGRIRSIPLRIPVA